MKCISKMTITSGSANGVNDCWSHKGSMAIMKWKQ